MNLIGWSGDLVALEGGGRLYHLFVRDVGPRSDSIILFLHGFPTSSLDWYKIADRFVDRRVIYVDLLGFGISEKPKIHYSYPFQADLLQALFKRLGVRIVSVVAHDYSVTLAQELLRREQAKMMGEIGIKQVVFLNGGVYGRLHRQQRFHRLLLTPLLGGFVARRITAEALAKGLNGIAGRPDAWSAADAQEHLDAMATNGGLGRMPRLLHYIAERQKHGAMWESAMEKAANKIGFVWGPADPVSGAHVLAEIKKRLPLSPAVSLDGVGHYPHWEAPPQTAEAILRILG